MTEDVFAGQWKEMRGALKSWWGKLTDDDFEWIGGQKDKLVGLLQEKYGYLRDQAQHEIERRFAEYSSKARDTAEAAGAYLQNRRLSDVTADLVALVRKYPVQSLLIGLGIGFLIARRRGD